MLLGNHLEHLELLALFGGCGYAGHTLFGIHNNHFKLMAIGLAVSRNLELTPDDCGYACMPLFHSNAMFIGFVPALYAGASIGPRERFSASSFLPDVLRHGVRFWNHVGEPVHATSGSPATRPTYHAFFADDFRRLREDFVATERADRLDR